MSNNHRQKVFVLGYLILLMWPIFAWAGDLEDAKNAYSSGRFEEAANLLRPLVRQEATEAVYLLARMYEKGDGVGKDIKEAKRLYNIAAAKGHEASQQKLDVFNVQTSDQSVVIEWYLPAAQEGDTEAQYNLGFMYETGWGVPENPEEAIRWYNEASDMQHDVAQLRLAMMQIVGVGVKSSTKIGLEMLRRSAENGNRIAEILIQDLFDVGDVSDKDAKQIVSGIRRIFDEGELETINALRRSLDSLRNPKPKAVPVEEILEVDNKPEGRKMEAVDLVKSVTRSTKSTKPTSAKIVSTKSVQKAKTKKTVRVPKTVPKGNLYKWYMEEANKGDADAQYHLGAMYIIGDKVVKDTEEGLHWMRSSAEQGHDLANTYMKLWDESIDEDTFGSTIAISWLRKAGREWNQQAIFTLGTLYETARGVEKNLKKATQWYKFAATNGHANAKRRLALMKKGGVLLEKESISSRGDATVSSISSLLISAVVAIVLGIVVYVCLKYFKKKAVVVPSQYQEKVVMAKAKNSQGLQSDDRKFFDELWADKTPKVPDASASSGAPAEAKKVEEPVAKPPVASEPKVEEKPPEIKVEEKPVVTSAADAKVKTEGLSEVEEKLAKAVEDLISGGAPDLSKDEKEKVSPAQNVKQVKISIESEPVKESIEKAVDATSDFTVEVDSSFGKSEAVLGADSFISSGISKDELAASRISADRLFADGVAIDEAGRAVGRGSYNPHKLDADSVLVDGESISKQSVISENKVESRKRVPTGAAASLLPKQAVEKPKSLKSSSFEIPDTPVEKRDISASLNNDEERSLAEVHYNIGLMFSSGDGVPKNDAQAAKWFLKAAEEGLPEGQFSLGQAYLNGNGVVKNTELAIDWIQKAADNNFKPAQEMLKDQHKAV